MISVITACAMQSHLHGLAVSGRSASCLPSPRRAVLYNGYVGPCVPTPSASKTNKVASLARSPASARPQLLMVPLFAAFCFISIVRLVVFVVAWLCSACINRCSICLESISGHSVLARIIHLLTRSGPETHLPRQPRAAQLS